MGMDEAIYIGAYWGRRPEGSESCAQRLLACLDALGRVSPEILGRWRPKGRKLGATLTVPGISISELIGLLEAGADRRDVGGAVISELGYSWSAWNGMSTSASSLSVTCGASMSPTVVLNSFVLELPYPSDEGAAGFYRRACMVRLLAAITDAWTPAIAFVTSHALRSAQSLEPSQPVAGWMTYLGPTRSPVPSVDGVDIQPMGEGNVVVLKGDWRSISMPEVERVGNALASGGVLDPIA